MSFWAFANTLCPLGTHTGGGTAPRAKTEAEAEVAGLQAARECRFSVLCSGEPYAGERKLLGAKNTQGPLAKRPPSSSAPSPQDKVLNMVFHHTPLYPAPSQWDPSRPSLQLLRPLATHPYTRSHLHGASSAPPGGARGPPSYPQLHSSGHLDKGWPGPICEQRDAARSE